MNKFLIALVLVLGFATPSMAGFQFGVGFGSGVRRPPPPPVYRPYYGYRPYHPYSSCPPNYNYYKYPQTHFGFYFGR